ncbi:gcn5-related n-acetyltransferase [Grosmannia clavigera kw1407]|uniref:Gcn5-related n-acetyltransferase n=1 Tax=Grosmannia clavigera (strain kw1407 / UAMH 11150) TaxID=655863 RepID=F0XKG8_GROCL|nr:gcn5-related n-acetyltransferase [Grosmannia clavigera kw1407]EFX01831.1 gcn5-related n-acetyltransferase [Grosmannia clavigera kw1407]
MSAAPEFSGLPIGPLVDATPATRPSHTTLAGRLVTLVPLDAEAHGAALFAATAGPGQDALWLYMGDGPYASLDTFREALRQKAASLDPLFFTIISNKTREPVGYASYLRIDPANRAVEVGNIMFSRALQRTAAATEALFLLARHAFDVLGFRRYEWKCNALNAPSRRAAERLGFVFEGVFRQHMIVKGRNRDTAWFSMLVDEWPARKAAFERWLAPENFDDEGHQRKTLERILS